MWLCIQLLSRSFKIGNLNINILLQLVPKDPKFTAKVTLFTL